MEKILESILTIARENVRQNPSLQNRSVEAVAKRYLNGLCDEVTEVAAELKADNVIYLEDELSDIVWDYTCLLAHLEYRGYIRNVESVLSYGLKKYSQRAPACLEDDSTMWDTIKAKQKEDLKNQHKILYGN